MTIELKLDTNALSHLIEQDSEFRLNLQQCVLENIAKRYVKGVSDDIQFAVKKAVEHEQNEVVKLFGTYSGDHWRSFKLDQKMIESISSSINAESKS